MSIIDLIMEQKLILITLCLAGAPLLTALTLFVVTTVRKRQAEQAEEARRLAARRKTMQAVARARRNAAAEAAALEEEVQPEAQEGEIPNPAMVKKIQTGPAAAGAKTTGGTAPVAVAAVGAKPAGGAAPAPAAAGGAPADKPAEEGVSDAMQSLLSDVFADDEAGARLDKLLAGVADVAIDDLADLAQSIAARLHEQAVPVKE